MCSCVAFNAMDFDIINYKWSAVVAHNVGSQLNARIYEYILQVLTGVSTYIWNCPEPEVFFRPINKGVIALTGNLTELMNHI